MLLVQVNNSDHFIPICREHVVPVFFDANNRDRIRELKDIVTNACQYIPFTHTTVIGRREDKLVGTACEHMINSVRVTDHRKIEFA
jgi:hypothetical protein